MPKPSMSRIRDCIRSLNYFVSLHAAEELEDDNLTILDLETVLLKGSIVERQRDHATREAKIIVRGKTIDNQGAEVVVKFSRSGALFIVTIYRV